MKNLNSKIVKLLLCFSLFLISQNCFSQIDWEIITTTAGQNLKSGAACNLKNLTAATKHTKFIYYEKRGMLGGINLGWTDNQNNDITIEGPKAGADILIGDKIAIKVKGGGYLKYQKRDLGINLTWSSTPVYEWIFKGKTTSETGNVKTGNGYGLLNQLEHEYIVSCKRSPPVHLGWDKDCHLGYRIAK